LTAATTVALAAVAHAGTTLRAVMHSDLKILDPIWTTAYIVRTVSLFHLRCVPAPTKRLIRSVLLQCMSQKLALWSQSWMWTLRSEGVSFA
jgi:hypothetical protein